MEKIEWKILREFCSSLAHSITHLKNRAEKTLVVYEFWHSLNRKGLVQTQDIPRLIHETISKL